MNNNRDVIYFTDILLCIIASILFYHIATWHIEFAVFNGEYTPAFPDSFYHATRILDSVKNGGLIQFDPRFHAPEGAWVTWPWGYDWFIARIIEITIFLTGMNPVKVMVNIPPIWGFVNIALLILLCRVINVSFPYRIIIILCFILLPLNQQLHLIGRIDHHYMEMTMVLLSFILTVSWFQKTKSRIYPTLFGVVLGGSIAIHTSLFVLQVPVISCLFIYWFLGKPLPETTKYFSISLLISTFLFLLPSETFHKGFFSFYYYSTFHLYISFCVASLSLLLLFIIRSRKNVLILIAISVLMLLPIINIFLSGYDFISGDWNYLNTMGEVKSFFTFKADQKIGVYESISNYSAFLFLLPISLGVILYLSHKKPTLENIFYSTFSVMAVFFLLKQIRFHYFGSYILYIPIVLLFQNIPIKVFNKNIRVLLLILLTLLAYWVPVGVLFKNQPGSPVFEATYWASKKLKTFCENDPGIILAPASVGHYLTYFTNCSVLANSFIMAPQDFKYLEKTDNYLNMTSKELLEKGKQIKYVFIMRDDNISLNLSSHEVNKINSKLSKELLLSNSIPANYQLLFEIKQKTSYGETPFARLLKIDR